LRGEIAIGETVHGLLAPDSALSESETGQTVHVVDTAGLAHRIEVEVLARDKGQVVLKGAGLSAGAQVITDGNYNLPDGAHVRPRT
jgi:multidrug efflux pump subunit AcrA (membrane-fusion protein)